MNPRRKRQRAKGRPREVGGNAPAGGGAHPVGMAHPKGIVHPKGVGHPKAPVHPKHLAQRSDAKPQAAVPARSGVPVQGSGPAPVANAPIAGKKTHWGDVAEWYDRLVGEEGSEYHREVVFPGVLRMLALRPEDRVLDVACGQGAFCRQLYAKGVRATGVDAAKELIEFARQRNEALGGSAGSATGVVTPPEYFVGDARELGFLPEGAFTAATCILAIQNIDTLPPVFSGVQRALGVGGRFVVVMMHPAFRGPKFTHWGWDEEEKVQYRRVDRYLLPRKDPIVTHPGKKTGEYTWSFHRPIGAYVKALRSAGMLVDSIEEWASHKVSEPGGRGAAENVARKEIPMFMAVRAVKTGMRAEG